MARMARVVVPDIPHHITQRGNRRQRVFFSDRDYRHYRLLISRHCKKANVAVWAYCLMPNHVHLVLLPRSIDGLHRSLAEAHRRYTRYVNFREGWRGYLWQGRFASFPMDESHLIAAVRYIELNPVRAGLCTRPGSWKWSSARAHLDGRDDELVSVAPMLNRVDDWSEYLTENPSPQDTEVLKLHERTGRPLGSDSFLRRLESLTGRRLRRQKPGPKRAD
jgi:putative transposase